VGWYAVRKTGNKLVGWMNRRNETVIRLVLENRTLIRNFHSDCFEGRCSPSFESRAGMNSGNVQTRHGATRKNGPNKKSRATMTTSNNSMNITLVNDETGQSESIPVSSSTSVQDLAEWASALLGIDDPVFLKHQRPIIASNSNNAVTLQAAGLQDGDLLMVVSSRRRSMWQEPPAAAAGAGLDFSGLLGGQHSDSGRTHGGAAAHGGLDLSQSLGQAATAAASTGTPNPVYFPGMSLHEAQSYNPHPHAFCQVLLDHDHLRKELNYYHPKLIADLFPAAVAAAAAASAGGHNDHHTTTIVVKHAAKVWRETMIKVRPCSFLSSFISSSAPIIVQEVP
jgi:hypothetical protein